MGKLPNGRNIENNLFLYVLAMRNFDEELSGILWEGPLRGEILKTKNNWFLYVFGDAEFDEGPFGKALQFAKY